MSSPVIEYTNLLHKKKSLNDPAVLAFKEDHKSDKTFVKQAEVVEWAFAVRNAAQDAKTVEKQAIRHPQPARVGG
jgi:hypothetical protein